MAEEAEEEKSSQRFNALLPPPYLTGLSDPSNPPSSPFPQIDTPQIEDR